MKTTKQLAAVTGLLIASFVVASTQSGAFDGKRSSAEKPAVSADDSQREVALVQKEAKKKKRKKARGRLPFYYGRVGISSEQRKTIYSIQALYRDKLEELQKQLLDMRAKRDKEIHDVLDEEQKAKLKKLQDEARKKRESRKKKKSKKKKSKA